MRLLATLIVLLLSGSTARAGLSRAELSSVSVALPANARLDLNLTARDANGKMRTIRDILGGRPAFLSFVDYTCNTLCGTDLELLSAGLQRAHINPSKYRILVLGIDPKDTPQSARALESHEIPAELQKAATFLLPDDATVDTATSSLGFHYVYDATQDQFAHPTVVYAIAPGGGVRAVLSPFALSTADLDKLLAPSAPVSRTLYERIRLICYGYDPATGIYNERIGTLLRMAGLLTVLSLGGGIFLLLRFGRKAA